MTWNDWVQQFKGFIIECRRVLAVTRKPTGDEFKTIVKISGIGIAIIGMIGFLIQMLRQLIG